MTHSKMLTMLAFMIVNPAAQATLTPNHPRGEQIIEFNVEPSGANEVCVIPNHPQNADYSEKDVTREQALCKINFYTNAAACPKTNSSNPGINIFTVPNGMSPQQVQAVNCKVKDPANPNKTLNKEIAKYKLSTSCSYTPALLGYYHLSRMLGGILNIPVAVVRTMNLENHMRIGAKGMKQIAETQGKAVTIYQTWSSLMSAFEAGAGSKRRDQLLTDNFDQSYGALAYLVDEDGFYSEFFNAGPDRAAAFRDRNAIFALLRRSNDVETFIGREFTQDNVQRFMQLRDAADFIALDSVMNQEDRFGNIHFQNHYVYRDRNDLDSDGNPKVKTKKSMGPSEIAATSALPVKLMLLNDNDCGVSRENRALKAGLHKGIMHMNPVTYRRLRHLDAIADDAEMVTFFRQNLLFTATDYKSVRQNLRAVVNQLTSACDSGKLKLDLDITAHFGNGAKRVVSCRE